MTAEPVCHEIALSNHMKVTLEYDPDGSRTAILWNEANEPIADGEAPVLAAAPAVQPAAGREEIASLMREPMVAVTSLDGTVREPLVCLTVAERDAILAALAHPPAHSGEPVMWRYRWRPAFDEPGEWREPTSARMSEQDRSCFEEQPLYAHPPAQGSESGPTCQKCGGEIHGWCCQSCDAEFRENDAGNLVFDDEAALSPQPGPASEGEGE